MAARRKKGRKKKPSPAVLRALKKARAARSRGSRKSTKRSRAAKRNLKKAGRFGGSLKGARRTRSYSPKGMYHLRAHRHRKAAKEHPRAAPGHLKIAEGYDYLSRHVGAHKVSHYRKSR